jgi:hypothetical protein
MILMLLLHYVSILQVPVISFNIKPPQRLSPSCIHPKTTSSVPDFRFNQSVRRKVPAARGSGKHILISYHTTPSSDATFTEVSLIVSSTNEAPKHNDSHFEGNGPNFIHDHNHRLLPLLDTSDCVGNKILTEATTATAPITTTAFHGLSKFHLSILSRTTDRQRVVTGRYPITVCAIRNPTRKWLNLGRRLRQDGFETAETEIQVNGTSPDRSLASIDRFHWIDENERFTLRNEYEMVSIELLAEINLERPGYLHILPADSAGSLADLVYKSNQLSGSNSNKLLHWNRWKSPSVLSNEHDDTTQLGRDRLWATGFSLAGRRGIVTSIDADTCRMNAINERSAVAMLWPNEVQAVPNELIDSTNVSSKSVWVNDDELANKKLSRDHQNIPIHDRSKFKSGKIYQDALLVCDGFLVPTKDRGGLYVIKHPGHPVSEWTVRLTDVKERWFYHRAVWIDLTNDGRKSILTARCKVSTVLGNRRSGDGMVTSGIRKYGQLIWLECPKPYTYDPETGTPLEKDGTVFDAFAPRHLPWKTRVLATGPDVMFSVADLDTTDDTIEVISSQFFKKKVSLHSIQKGTNPHVTFSRVIDEHCGQAFGSILADLDRGMIPNSVYTDGSDRVVIDSGSTVKTLKNGDFFSHVLVTSHECAYKPESKSDGYTEKRDKSYNTNVQDLLKDVVTDTSSSDGGSLYSYRVPTGKDAWKTQTWKRSTIASGFKVNGQLNNMINPGAPGFVYTFYSHKSATNKRPLIAVAGDCAETASIFRPAKIDSDKDRTTNNFNDDRDDMSSKYKLMVEFDCGATVGSIGIGYDDFSSAEQEGGFAKLYIPCYEKDKVLVFGLGSGEEDMDYTPDGGF